MRLPRFLGGGQGLQSYLDRFAATELPAVLKRLDRPPAKVIEPFPSGRNTLVRKVILSDASALVLRIFAADPVKRKSFTHCHLNRLLAREGFRVAEIYFQGSYRFPRGKSDAEVVIEEFVEGRTLDDSLRDDEDVRLGLAELLRRLHSNVSPLPGRTWLKRKDSDPVEAAVAKAPVLLERIRAQLAEVSNEDVRHAMARIEKAAGRYRAPESYELVHGDFSRANLILTAERNLALIDLGTMAYGCFESDLVHAREGFFDRAWWTQFCEDYFAGAEEKRERFEESAPLFFALNALVEASSRAVRARKAAEKRNEKAVETYRAEARRFWDAFCTNLKD